MKYQKIIVVGEMNVARSFLGETVLRGILAAKGFTQIEVISRGLVVLFSEPVSLSVLNILKKYNYEIETFRSTQLTREDVMSAQLILTVTKEQAQSIKEQYITEDMDVTCVFLGDFVPSGAEVPYLNKDAGEDTEEAFEIYFSQMEKLMEKVADRIIEESF